MVVVSFDTDGTLVTGDPSGPIELAPMVALLDTGTVIGPASDRPRPIQDAMWAEAVIMPAFTGGEHHLPEVRARHAYAARFVHVGDTEIDEHFARQAGFEFVWMTEYPQLHPQLIGARHRDERWRPAGERGWSCAPGVRVRSAGGGVADGGGRWALRRSSSRTPAGCSSASTPSSPSCGPPFRVPVQSADPVSGAEKNPLVRASWLKRRSGDLSRSAQAWAGSRFQAAAPTSQRESGAHR
jgi:hypothetical protein